MFRGFFKIGGWVRCFVGFVCAWVVFTLFTSFKKVSCRVLEVNFLPFYISLTTFDKDLEGCKLFI